MAIHMLTAAEQEKNPWLAAEARFDNAAEKLGLDDGMRKVLQSPDARDHRQHPRAAG